MRRIMLIAMIGAAVALVGCSEKPTASKSAEPATIESGESDPALATTELKPADAAGEGPGPIVIDVRTPQEWEAGHLDAAVLIPHDQIEAKIAEVTTDKDRPIYLHCRSGGRAAKAKARLESMGYTNVTNLGSLEDARRRVASQPTQE